ncbi:MAG: hypothetical protein ABEH81_02100 [Halopenitus sp.]
MAHSNSTGFPARLRGIVTQAWKNLLSVYCANTPVWRLLKSGALIFLGLFLWMGGNVLLAYWPDLTALDYVAAYGFVLLLWGPLTHLVVVPAIIRLRRTASHPAVRQVVEHASKLNYGLFLALVVVVGATTPGVMLFDFTAALGESGSTVDAEVVCDVGAETVSCHLEKSHGVDHVVLVSGGEELDRAATPPYRVTAPRKKLARGPTGRQYVIELRNADGETVRRFVRIVDG